MVGKQRKFNSRCSKMAILASLKPSKKPIKSQPFSTSGCFWYFINFTNWKFCVTRQNSDPWYIPSEVTTYKLKSTWNPPKGPPALELFLSKVQEDIFSVLPGHPKKFNLNRGEYLSMRCLQNDRSVIIKPADKGSALVVWDRQDY